MTRLSIFFVFVWLCFLSLKADIVPGTWIVHPSFVVPAMKVVETPSKVWLLTGGSLFSIDKKTDETVSYVYGAPLGDVEISDIYYDAVSSSLIVAYENGNIDVFDKNGDIINIPDIKNARDVYDKSINGVAFDGKKAYIATGFGLVALNFANGKILDSGRYDVSVDAIEAFNGYLLIIADGKLYSIDENSRINKLESFIERGKVGQVDEMKVLLSGQLLLRSFDELKLGVMDENGFHSGESVKILPRSLVTGGDCVYALGADVRLISIDNEGSVRFMQQMPAVATDEAVGGWNMEKEYWSVTKSGILKRNYSDGSWIDQSERFIPVDALTVRSVDFIIPGNTEDRIYFGNLGATLYRNGATDALDVMQQMALRSPSGFSDSSADGVVGEFDNVKWKQTVHGPYLITPQRFAESPLEPDVYFIGTGNDGLYKVENRKFKGRYAGENSPITDPWGYRVFEVAVDKGGNLWVGFDGRESETGVAILPADKLRLEPEQVSASDWVKVDVKGMPLDRDMRIFHCKRSPVTVIFNWNGDDGILFYHNGSTAEDLSDDHAVLVTRLVDQDGQIFSPERFTSIAEDHKGNLWIGCEGGVIEISQPDRVIDSYLDVRRIKIAHDDGTGLADYLCETDLVYDISIDGADRKWIATAESGVYLINKEGTAVISNFTTENSPLPSNKVKSVYADPLGNSVFMGTAVGLIEYGNDASEPQENFSSIKVYPNPVTPRTPVDFVTISGLTDNAEVKITDSTGGLVWYGRAEGGLARWSLRGLSGNRVASGIYYVFLSSEKSGNAVAKIMIVN